MTATVFRRIAAGLQEARAAVILAKSDAEFDGRTFDALGNADRARYIQRAAKGLAAVSAAQMQPKLVEALRFYANPDDWSDFASDCRWDEPEGCKFSGDQGQTARDALASLGLMEAGS